MISRHHGFISLLKNAIPGMLTVRCVIHREHLVAKTISGWKMNTVISAINTIKAQSPNSRLF